MCNKWSSTIPFFVSTETVDQHWITIFMVTNLISMNPFMFYSNFMVLCVYAMQTFRPDYNRTMGHWRLFRKKSFFVLQIFYEFPLKKRTLTKLRGKNEEKKKYMNIWCVLCRLYEIYTPANCWCQSIFL